MATLTYTYNFDYTVGAEFIRGEAGMDNAKKFSYKISQTSDPISNEFMASFIALMEQIKSLYDKKGDIIRINFIKKP